MRFEEVTRIKDLHVVNGKKYDALTFAIIKTAFLGGLNDENL